jgi:hypothetical protein
LVTEPEFKEGVDIKTSVELVIPFVTSKMQLEWWNYSWLLKPKLNAPSIFLTKTKIVYKPE